MNLGGVATLSSDTATITKSRTRKGRMQIFICWFSRELQYSKSSLCAIAARIFHGLGSHDSKLGPEHCQVAVRPCKQKERMRSLTTSHPFCEWNEELLSWVRIVDDTHSR